MVTVKGAHLDNKVHYLSLIYSSTRPPQHGSRQATPLVRHELCALPFAAVVCLLGERSSSNLSTTRWARLAPVGSIANEGSACQAGLEVLNKGGNAGEPDFLCHSGVHS